MLPRTRCFQFCYRSALMWKCDWGMKTKVKELQGKKHCGYSFKGKISWLIACLAVPLAAKEIDLSRAVNSQTRKERSKRADPVPSAAAASKVAFSFPFLHRRSQVVELDRDVFYSQPARRPRRVTAGSPASPSPPSHTRSVLCGWEQHFQMSEMEMSCAILPTPLYI